MPVAGALFVFLCRRLISIYSISLCLSLIAATGFSSARAACNADHFDLTTNIKYIVDGDTIKIESGERVRLIGINTPELGHNGQKPDAFALAAKNRLTRLIYQQNNQIKLRYDTQKRDKYHRLLAHVYLNNGVSISEWLLEQGLATRLTVPPNTWQLPCYQAAEKRAQLAGRGIWSLPDYQPVESTTLKPGQRGFRLVRGKVVRIGHSKKSVWLNLAGNTALRIDRKDLGYFQQLEPESLKDKIIVARGWLYSYNGENRLRIRHPAALQIIQKN